MEGFAVGGERRHINSAFFSYRPCDEGVTLPRLIPDSQVHCQCSSIANAWLNDLFFFFLLTAGRRKSSKCCC